VFVGVDVLLAFVLARLLLLQLFMLMRFLWQLLPYLRRPQLFVRLLLLMATLNASFSMICFDYTHASQCARRRMGARGIYLLPKGQNQQCCR